MDMFGVAGGTPEPVLQALRSVGRWMVAGPTVVPLVLSGHLGQAPAPCCRAPTVPASVAPVDMLVVELFLVCQSWSDGEVKLAVPVVHASGGWCCGSTAGVCPTVRTGARG